LRASIRIAASAMVEGASSSKAASDSSQRDDIGGLQMGLGPSDNRLV
jgi:hypothetical protein